MGLSAIAALPDYTSIGLHPFADHSCYPATW
jgi:hypothetical protein